MQALYERSEDRLRTYWPAGTVDLLEGCQGVFQTFVDVRFQRLGGSVDVAGKCRFKYQKALQAPVRPLQHQCKSDKSFVQFEICKDRVGHIHLIAPHLDQICEWDSLNLPKLALVSVLFSSD